MFGTLGYEFHRRSEQTGRFSEIHPSSPEFDEKILDLAQVIHSQLHELRRRLLAPPPDLGVYVAAVSSDLASWRTRLLDQLTAWNCRVAADSVPIAQFSGSAIQDAFKDCAFSIHLIGPKKGMIPEDETLPLDLLQLACARSSHLDRIVCHVGEPHAGWSNLQKPEGTHGREDLITDPDALLQLVEDRVGMWRKERSTAGTSGALPIVYVVCSPSEFDDAIRLKKCLEAEQRCAAMLPIREVEDSRVRLTDHRRTLKDCEAVLIYWGAASSPYWFREQQREVIVARGKRRSKSLPVLCLASCPHANPEADALPGLPLKKISSLDCSSVRPFFDHLEIGRNGSRA